MGTSNMYLGPSRNPLLPKDFDEPKNPSIPKEEQDENNNESQSNDSPDDSSNIPNREEQALQNSKLGWQGAKNAMSRFASGSSRNYKVAVSRYVKAYGGSKSASKTAKSGIKATVNVGRFFSNTYSQGIRTALDQIKISFEGKSVKEVLNEVINALYPKSITKEDTIARKSVIRTMEVLYEKMENENKDFSSLERIDKEFLNELILIQIESYIYERLINDLGSRIETNSSSPSVAINKEKEIKDYINSKVETTLKDKDFSQTNFDSNKIEKEIEGLYIQCYKVMEDML